MQCRVDILHPLLYIECLWHNRARTVQLVKRASSRGALGRIGAFFARFRAFWGFESGRFWPGQVYSLTHARFILAILARFPRLRMSYEREVREVREVRDKSGAVVQKLEASLFYAS